MDAETRFRGTLVGQLKSLANSRELDEHLVQMDYVEDKQDALGGFLDYYTDTLLTYDVFVKEFEPLEIEEMREFLCALEGAIREKTRWEDVRAVASRMLACLERS